MIFGVLVKNCFLKKKGIMCCFFFFDDLGEVGVIGVQMCCSITTPMSQGNPASCSS
jgi:hypothetical protein